MLQFIYGKASSGKTFTVLNIIKELTDLGTSCILIVPEQFTFENERAVLKKLGDKASLSVGVFSFSRLCDEVGHKVGGIAGITLGECDKIIFMKRALSLIESELKLWMGYSKSVSFAKTMLDTIGEFKINAITAEEIRNASEIVKSPKLRLKLHDISLIYEAYDMLIGEKYIDPADSLTKLYEKLEDYSYFKNKTVFIDSFKGFTGQQFKIIERIFSQADDVYISLTNNPENSCDYNIYSNIRLSSERIKKIAQKYGKKVMKPIYLNKSFYSNDDLIKLENLISGEKIEKVNQCNNITVCKSATSFDEANFVARTIRRLIREKGYRFRDFVIIARDAESYKEAVTAACKRNKVSLFFDNRIPLSAFPLARAAQAAIAALNFSTENILRFHKTGLGLLNTEEISALENYTYLWNINGQAWLEEFKADPRGFVTEDTTEESENELNKINLLRIKAIEPIVNLKSNFNCDAEKMSKAIVKLFDECNCSEKLAELCNKLSGISDDINEDVLRQSYEEYMRILDSLVRCFGEASISKSEYIEALNIAVSLADIGVIPQMLDQVTFGSADRIRPSRPKIAFILGANQGIFPKVSSNAGILNLTERKNLIEYGIEIADNSVFSSIDEEYLVYCNLCCPSDAIYISYALQTISGENLEPSAFVYSIMENINCNTFKEPIDAFFDDNIPETEDAVFTEFCRRIISDKNNAFTLKSSVEDDEKYRDIISLTIPSDKSIKPETAKELFGENIRMSASKFDVFNRCRFSFFCRYGLNAKKLQPADFDVMQKGTIVHYVLERFITENKDNLAELDTEKINYLTDKYIEDYLNSISGFRTVENARTEFLVSRLSRSLKEVVKHITEELLQSDFKPIACELKIGKGCEQGELIFPYDNGNISVIGSIDRVDTYNGYIRIIDYKTGSKNFKLPDILFGLNLQMLIYLYAVTRGDGLSDKLAAGILYQPSKRDINDSGMAMNGLLQSDEALIYAMDKHGEGDYVPKLSFNKDGSIAKRCTSFIKTEEFSAIFDHIEKLMRKTGNTIASGDIAVSPLDGRESPACKYCDYSKICGIENRVAERVPDYNNSEFFEKMKEGENNGI